MHNINMDNYIEFIKARCKDLNDIYYRNIQIEKMRVFIAYNEALVDSNLISNYVIRSVVEILKDTTYKLSKLPDYTDSNTVK